MPALHDSACKRSTAGAARQLHAVNLSDTSSVCRHCASTILRPKIDVPIVTLPPAEPSPRQSCGQSTFQTLFSYVTLLELVLGRGTGERTQHEVLT